MADKLKQEILENLVNEAVGDIDHKVSVNPILDRHDGIPLVRIRINHPTVDNNDDYQKHFGLIEIRWEPGNRFNHMNSWEKPGIRT